MDGEQNVDSSTDSILGITATTAIRPTIYDLFFGSSATPADNAVTWYGGRHTAAGTSTAVTPQAIDEGDPTATASSGENHTVEPTYTANAILFRLALNQRSSWRWIADPDGGMVAPATANNGITFYPVHASFTGLCDMTIHYYE